MGGRKLLKILKPLLIKNNIKIGRVLFYRLLRENNLLVKMIKALVPKTTNSNHLNKKFPNIIKGFIPNAPNQLWASDITYIKIEKYFLYLSLITDAFSHKIVGHCIAETLETSETTKALKMALKSIKNTDKSELNLIHHSDRGSQYCNHAYVNLLNSNNIKISMTETGDPRDNAIAERVNGILKQEYFTNMNICKSNDIHKILNKIIYLYNNERPHSSIGNEYPSVIHENKNKTKNLWKSYEKM